MSASQPGAASTAASSAPPARRNCLDVAAHAFSVPQARAHVRSTLVVWGLSHVRYDAEVVASELITNAITASAALPAPGRVSLRLAAYPDRLILAVRDASHLPPVPLPREDDAEAGRGLSIVGALSANWGYELRADGKIVWARLDLRPPPG